MVTGSPADRLSSFLEAEGYPTVVTGSAEDGRAASASPPRLAIVDLMTSNGLTVQLCEDLTQAGVPALAMSILPPPTNLRSSRFLRKPVHPLQVLVAVRWSDQPVDRSHRGPAGQRQDRTGAAVRVRERDRATTRDLLQHRRGTAEQDPVLRRSPGVLRP
jgi:DNA-binding response OmpR family regulator